MDKQTERLRLTTGIAALGALSTGVGTAVSVIGIASSLLSESDAPLGTWTRCGIAAAAVGMCLVVLTMLFPGGNTETEDNAG